MGPGAQVFVGVDSVIKLTSPGSLPVREFKLLCSCCMEALCYFMFKLNNLALFTSKPGIRAEDLLGRGLLFRFGADLFWLSHGLWTRFTPEF